MIAIDEEIKAIRDSVTGLFEKGDFDEGVRQMENNAQLPQVVRLECLGNLHFYKRELQEAINKYESSILIDPEYLIARYQYLVGVQEEKKDDFVSAFKRYQAAIEIEPTFIDAYVELGALLIKVGDFKGAAQCYRDALRLAPADITNVHNLKSVLLKLLSTDPDCKTELAIIEGMYNQLAQSGATLPTENHW
jgi:tetratricopeptide (TPR) repeat protein